MFISSPVYDNYEDFDDFQSTSLLSLDFRDSSLNDFEQKFECVQELKEQVYDINEDGEELLAYEETSMDNYSIYALESLKKGTYLFLIMEDKGQYIFQQNDIFELSFTEISNNSKCIYDSFDFQEVNVQENFKVHEKFGFQRFNYHKKMQSFNKENKEEHISQISYS